MVVILFPLGEDDFDHMLGRPAGQGLSESMETHVAIIVLSLTGSFFLPQILMQMRVEKCFGALER